MSTSDGDTGNETENDGTRTRSVPVHLLGRFRTSTVGLIVAFVLVLGLYLYTRPDPTTVENSPVYVPPTTSTQVAPTQEYVPTRTPSTTTAPTATSSVAPTPGSGSGGEGSGSTSGTSAPTTAAAPGFQLPTIPGIQIPGLAPTTTPAR
ncbi:hypothetical protein ACNHUS_00515 [Actinomycetes bacterium M1A6_2h]